MFTDVLISSKGSSSDYGVTIVAQMFTIKTDVSDQNTMVTGSLIIN